MLSIHLTAACRARCAPPLPCARSCAARRRLLAYRSALHDGRKIVRDSLTWFLAREKLDAFVVPTASRPPRLIKDEGVTPPHTIYGSTAILANLTGWPDLIVPAGFTSDPTLPVGLSFIGPAFSEARLLALGYAFEQAHPARALPVTTPALPGETIEY